MSLQAYFKMDSGWFDYSGNNYDGVPSGAIINNVNQKIGAGCGQFLTNDKITYPSFFDPTGLSTFSMEGWFKQDLTGAAIQRVFGWNGVCDVTLHNNANYILFIGTSQGRLLAQDFNTDWVHFAMVYDGGLIGNDNRLKLYVNSVAQTLSFPSGAVPAVLPERF